MSQPVPRGAAAPLPSPFRSTIAVLAGFVVNFFLSGIGAQMLASILPSEFPLPVSEDVPPVPTTLGLSLVVALFAANALLSGVVTARVAQTSPVAHAGILAGLFGLFALYGIEQARPYPAWVAIAFVLVPPAFAIVGGLLGKRAAAARAARAEKIVVETLSS